MNTYKCPICQKNKSKKLITSPKLKVQQCLLCGMNFVPPQTVTDKPDGDYIDEYPTKEYITYYKQFRTRTFKQNWKEILALQNSGDALDFGASYGWFITSAPKSWNVMGIDASKKTSSYARARGIKVLYGDEHTIQKNRKKFDLISLHNVFEHLPDPRYSLKVFHNALKKDGLLLIAVPNKEGLINRFSCLISKINIFSPVYTLFQVGSPSPHYGYYNIELLQKILKKEGFEIVKVKYQPIIDINTFDKRLAIEKEQSRFKSIIIKSGVYLVYHLSEIFHMSDEIAVYARKIAD